MADQESGTATEQPAVEDTIRSSLAAAFAEAEKPAGETAATEKLATEAATTEGETETAAEKRARDASGKFAKAEGADKKEKTEATEKPDTAAKGEKKDAKAETPATGTEPPTHWSAKDKETFKALPPQAQTFVLDRHKAMEADYTKKTQEIASLRNEYAPVDKMFEPHREAMRAKGFTPRTLIESWANVETRLMNGDGVTIVKGLVDGYKIDKARLAAALGLTAQVAGEQQQQTDQTQTDPARQIQLPPELMGELRALRERQDVFDRRIQSENANRLRERENSIQTEIDSFKSKTNEKGELLHPHFEEVEDVMNRLAQAALASKQPIPPLAQLYEDAVWATPSTREKLRTAEQQQAEDKRNAEARSKAAAAKKAGSSVTGAPGVSGQTAMNGSGNRSLRDELLAASEDT